METITETKKAPLYHRKGQMNVVNSVVAIILGIGIALILYVFFGTLAGQTYQLVETDIDAITNTSVKNYIKQGIVKGFEAYKQEGQYMPLIVLALVIGIVLSIIMSLMVFANMGGGRGGGFSL